MEVLVRYIFDFFLFKLHRLANLSKWKVGIVF